MGVKDLWLTLSPSCGKKSLWELRNHTVAVDLSVWICENQTIDFKNNNLYLRNLFFRTSYMLLLGIKPIFALEGIAPELKHDVMKQRRDTQNKVKGKSVVESQERGSRSRLISLQKQCEELLNCMGVQCVYSNGEAEALCAALNSEGIVDGVISKDSDCFLYGARIVYRNFNISCNGGTCEKYDMETIKEKLNLGRNKLIALSLLCGCDYNKGGIDGVGKEKALKFLSTVNEEDILERLSKWRADEHFETISKVEEAIKTKALLNPDFPFYNVQNEFLNFTHNVRNVKYSWKKPNLQSFLMYVERKLGWPTDYAIEKFLPLLSRWHLLNDTAENVLSLDYIVKKRNLRGIPSFQVKWKEFDQNTIEPMSFLKLKYQLAVEEFEAAKLKKKATSKKKKNNILGITQDLHNLSIVSPSPLDDSITVSDFECSASDLLELSAIVESIVTRT